MVEDHARQAELLEVVVLLELEVVVLLELEVVVLLELVQVGGLVGGRFSGQKSFDLSRRGCELDSCLGDMGRHRARS